MFPRIQLQFTSLRGSLFAYKRGVADREFASTLVRQRPRVEISMILCGGRRGTGMRFSNAPQEREQFMQKATKAKGTKSRYKTWQIGGVLAVHWEIHGSRQTYRAASS